MSTLPAKRIEFHNHIWLPGDPDGDDLVRAMDAAGIEWAIVHACPSDIWSYTGDNDDIVRAVGKHPGRLVGAMHLDFRLGVAACVSMVRRYADAGLRGAKMFPGLGFAIDEPRHYPIYQALSDAGLFAAYHMGYLAGSDMRPVPMSCKYAQPFNLEELAVLFPRVPFVICHMGGVPSYEQTLCVIRHYPNIWADTAPGYGMEAFRYMGKLVQMVTWDKILFGTDTPADSWPKIFDFWQANAEELGYADNLNALFHDNAARFLEHLGQRA